MEIRLWRGHKNYGVRKGKKVLIGWPGKLSLRDIWLMI